MLVLLDRSTDTELFDRTLAEIGDIRPRERFSAHFCVVHLAQKTCGIMKWSSHPLSIISVEIKG